MNRKRYGGITFQEGYSRTFDQFKAEFEDTWVFQSIKAKDRLNALKEAFKIAISDSKVKKAEKIEVVDPIEIKEV